jgi:hypothetical protein
MKTFIGKELPLKRALSVFKTQWESLPAGTVVVVHSITEPQVFLKPKVEFNPDSAEILRASTVRIQRPVWSDMVLNLSMHPWIYLAWNVISDGMKWNATMLELWYCLAPEDFIEITERLNSVYETLYFTEHPIATDFLLEGQAYWGAEFWGRRITSPMQLTVRQYLEKSILGRKFILLKNISVWRPEDVTHSGLNDPLPGIAYEAEAVWDVQPGVTTVVDGSLSLKFTSEEGTYFARLDEFVNAVGGRLPHDFSAKDPWVDRQVGLHRNELWLNLLRAKDVVSRFVGKELALPRPIAAKFSSSGELMQVPKGSRIRLLPVGPHGFSRQFTFVGQALTTNLTAEESLWPLEKQLFLGLFRYRDVGYDFVDRDGMVGTARLVELADLLSPGSVQLTEE